MLSSPKILTWSGGLCVGTCMYRGYRVFNECVCLCVSVCVCVCVHIEDVGQSDGRSPFCYAGQLLL